MCCVCVSDVVCWCMLKLMLVIVSRNGMMVRRKIFVLSFMVV